MGTPNLDMNGHQRTTGKVGTLASFLIHHLPVSSPESAHEQEQVSHHSTIFVKVYLFNI